MLSFYLALSFIFLHEMDAIRCKEWRIFPILKSLPDKLGMQLFILLHIPIFIWLFYELSDISFITFNNFRRNLDVFLIIHVFMHLVVLNTKENQFKDWLSWLLILGAGFWGALDLMLK
jgi:hypothetical protein